MSHIDTEAGKPADPAAAVQPAAAAKPIPEDSVSEDSVPEDDAASPKPGVPVQKPGEIGGPRGPEPTRYGDWESKGRCTDF
ncbi:succinate dehydrogenase assembly factor 4 [Skermanella pratensis]|uniref:succinate dehydrogenase assembly factor 4 n=1 Tax=Skermanella pratensis TaxID=2233999 RepID=UPI00130107BF|nr:succinate dehydrogenase assembly factor 4 [Skermanella pratensis]